PFAVGTNGQIIIDTTPPQVVAVAAGPGHAQMDVYFRDTLSGMSVPTILNAFNYTLVGRGDAGIHPYAVSLIPSAGLPAGEQGVVLAFSGGPRLLGRLRTFRITAAGITDNAGNPLFSNYHVPVNHIPRSIVALGHRVPRGPR